MLITAPQVAAKLGYSLSYYRKRWRRWRSTLGFPAPSIGYKWESEAIDVWLRDRAVQGMVLEAPPERDKGGGRERTTPPPPCS